ncbi:MAG: hypothetical protein HY924_11335 [Elusimicrobia bacterium]|nr:hypothetical protein [Elusimicrobiota bacterium]
MKKTMLAVPLSLALAAAVPSWAGEHPKEHPTAAPAEREAAKPSVKSEHPAGHEHPVGSKAWNSQMRKEFNETVESHVSRESAGGAFKVKDDKLGKEWALKLVGVHKKRIVGLGGRSFFACADFETVGKGEKAKLDLDFYATKGPDGWKIDKTVIHKVNGKPRYTYNDKNEMVPASD